MKRVPGWLAGCCVVRVRSTCYVIGRKNNIKQSEDETGIFTPSDWSKRQNEAQETVRFLENPTSPEVPVLLYIYRVKNVLLILVGRLGCSATFSVPASLASRGRYHFGNAYDMI